MADAGVTVVDCIRRLHENGSNLVIEILKEHSEFVEWEHYPPEDVRDPISGAQYYFHAHSLEDRAEPDFGHFHTFLRISENDVVRDYISHLIAISMTPSGMPVRIFTTNRWVTGETWRSAKELISNLDQFSIEPDGQLSTVHQWLTAMFVLFRPQIEHLLLERDRVLADWKCLHPSADAFEDRRLEITSVMPVSLQRQIEWLDRDLSH